MPNIHYAVAFTTVFDYKTYSSTSQTILMIDNNHRQFSFIMFYHIVTSLEFIHTNRLTNQPNN